MITKDNYIARRKQLVRPLDSGIIVMLGNRDTPFNYPANPYDFRQDSNFLYFYGIDRPGVAAVIDLDSGTETLFGDDADLATIVWIGEQPSIEKIAADCGVAHASAYSNLKDVVAAAIRKGRKIHYLPFYRNAGRLEMADLTRMAVSEVNQQVSVPLIKSVIALRSRKDPAEISELEEAVDIAREMHLAVMKMAIPGITEQAIAGRIKGIAFSRGKALSFPPIISIDGDILHNVNYHNTLTSGRLLLTDAGAENNGHYTSDISRTVPVGGKFNDRQRRIYEIVLQANTASIAGIGPGVRYRDIHLDCARIIVDGLKEMGLMRGNTDDAVGEGAHALFLPHGLGHMLGLDAHDMEGLGEDQVGYDDEFSRSSQFGLSSLRLAKRLEAGYVVTVEPGIYFIPLLIDQWREEPKWRRYIDFETVETYKGFGGVRIEDNILVTEEGNRNLSRDIPKTVAEIEAVMTGS